MRRLDRFDVIILDDCIQQSREGMEMPASVGGAANSGGVGGLRRRRSRMQEGLFPLSSPQEDMKTVHRLTG